MAVHLITGGSGFIGSNLAKLLIARGEKVRILDLWIDPNADKQIEFFIGDINDRILVDRAIEGVDFVHHNVALVPLSKAGNEYQRVNVQGTQTILEAAIKAKVKMFSHMSSSAVFGLPTKMPITNETDRKPIEIYGHAKLAGEKLVLAAANEGMKVTIIRPRTVIGTGRLGIFQVLFEWIADGSNIFVIGEGSQLFQFVHVDDLCEVSIRACLQDTPGVYNIGTDQYGSLREDLEFLCDHAGTGVGVKKLPVKFAIEALKLLDRTGLSPLSPWHYLTYHKAYYFDSEPVYKALKWRPQYSNRAMMTKSYDWFIENRYTMKTLTNESPHKKPVKQGILKVIKYLSKVSF